jgi:chromosome segregation ATPase
MRGEMEEHYLTQQHQDTVIKTVRQMRSRLLDSPMDIDPSRATANITTASNPATADWSKLHETLNILTGGIEALNDDGQRLSNESLQSQIRLQELAEDISKMRISVEESQGFLQGVKYNQDILSRDLTLLKEKINEMQYVSYDGTLVWKITNFQERMSK